MLTHLSSNIYKKESLNNMRKRSDINLITETRMNSSHRTRWHKRNALDLLSECEGL